MVTQLPEQPLSAGGIRTVGVAGDFSLTNTLPFRLAFVIVSEADRD